ncbi:MAG: FKBP-type peptidyl-prolyl cis-trans isomerase [Faecalibacterium prausnitzii]
MPCWSAAAPWPLSWCLDQPGRQGQHRPHRLRGPAEGKPFNGGAAQNQTLQLGSGRTIPGFEEGILGHKGGEEFDIFVTFPARYHATTWPASPWSSKSS